MGEFTKKHEQMLEETHNAVIRIKTVLLDTNGNPGLVSKVNEVCESHYRLKRNFWVLVAFLVGTGILGASILNVLVP